jgi:hypothetical protein
LQEPWRAHQIRGDQWRARVHPWSKDKDDSHGYSHSKKG